MDVIPIRPAEEQTDSARKPRGKLSPGRHPWTGVSGGFIHVARDGGLSYYAKRKIHGVWYGPVLLGHEAEIAHDAYKGWWPNPAGWQPEGKAPQNPVYLTADLIDAYTKWCAKPRPGTKRKRNRDADWIRQKKNRLIWWMERLHGKSLRSDGTPGCVTRDTLDAILGDGVDYRGRLQTIRAFYTFLRTASVNDLPVSSRVLIQHDPAKDIPLPSSEPEQAVKGSKVAWSKEDSDRVIEWLEAYQSAGQGGKAGTPRVRAPDDKVVFTSSEAAEHLGLTVKTVRVFVAQGLLQHDHVPPEPRRGGPPALVFLRKYLDRFERSRDARMRSRKQKDTPHRVALALTVLGGTASHAREIARFSRGGGIVIDLEEEHVRQNGAEKKIVFEHKTGKAHAQAISGRVASAAEELLRLGGVSYSALFNWTAKAVKATGVAKFSPGRFRHRGATLALNRGVPKKAVGENIGHTNEKTTSIYTLTAAQPKMPTWY